MIREYLLAAIEPGFLVAVAAMVAGCLFIIASF